MFLKSSVTILFIIIISISPVYALQVQLINGTLVIYDEQTHDSITIFPSEINALVINSILFFQPDDDGEYILVVGANNGLLTLNLIISYPGNHPNFGQYSVYLCD